MIITEKVQVTIMYKNIEHYKSKGYKVFRDSKGNHRLEDKPVEWDNNIFGGMSWNE